MQCLLNVTVGKTHRPSAGLNVICKDQAFSSLPHAHGPSFDLLGFRGAWDQHSPGTQHPAAPALPQGRGIAIRGAVLGMQEAEPPELSRLPRRMMPHRGAQVMGTWLFLCPSQQNGAE